MGPGSLLDRAQMRRLKPPSSWSYEGMLPYHCLLDFSDLLLLILIYMLMLIYMLIVVIDSDGREMSPLVPPRVMFWLINGRSKGHSALKVLSMVRGHFAAGSHHRALHLGRDSRKVVRMISP